LNLKPLLDTRAWAVKNGDLNAVAEIDAYLRRLGYVELAVSEEPQERAVPVKRGPGRPRKNPVPEAK
jgi:hypothetical protein